MFVTVLVQYLGSAALKKFWVLLIVSRKTHKGLTWYNVDAFLSLCSLKKMEYIKIKSFSCDQLITPALEIIF